MSCLLIHAQGWLKEMSPKYCCHFFSDSKSDLPKKCTTCQHINLALLFFAHLTDNIALTKKVSMFFLMSICNSSFYSSSIKRIFKMLWWQRERKFTFSSVTDLELFQTWIMKSITTYFGFEKFMLLEYLQPCTTVMNPISSLVPWKKKIQKREFCSISKIWGII